MTSGGARARSGPPPDPNALRRERPSDSAEWLHLPHAGRAGDPPAWPLRNATGDTADDANIKSWHDRELERWAIEWRKPQAIAWERFALADEVALYVRLFVECEIPGTKADVRTLLRRYQESLGLTVAGQRANRWVIDPPLPGSAANPDNAAGKVESMSAAKARLAQLRAAKK